MFDVFNSLLKDFFQDGSGLCSKAVDGYVIFGIPHPSEGRVQGVVADWSGNRSYRGEDVFTGLPKFLEVFENLDSLF